MPIFDTIIPVSIALLGISSVFYEDLGHSCVALTMDYFYIWTEDYIGYEFVSRH
jgi:hypothetical protein